MNQSLGFVHRFQPAKDESTRTLLLLHGTGGDENSLFPLAEIIDPTAAVLSVKGKVLENGAPRFFRRLEENVFDMEDLIARTHELADFVEAAVIEYGFGVDELFAVGYSNGANIASSMMFLRPDSLAGAMLFRATVPFEPSEIHDLSMKRVFISEGKFDPLVHPDKADHLAMLLRAQSADVTLHWNELDHRLGRPELDVAAAWLDG